MYDTTALGQNGFCEEAGGERTWHVLTYDSNDNYNIVPFVCDPKSDMTDCCGIVTWDRRRLSYTYNASAALPAVLPLPLTPPMVKQILDDRSVVKVHLPPNITGIFYTLAYAVAGQTASTPNPASGAGCMATSLMQAVDHCELATQQACTSSYVRLVEGRIGGACGYNVVAGACERGQWYQYC